MKQKVIIGVIIGLIIGLIVGVIISNSIQKQPDYYDFTLANAELDSIKASDFDKIEYTSQDCYEYFINEKISHIENPYNKNEWVCLIDSFGIYSLRNPSTDKLSLFWYNPSCKCWKK